MAWALRSCLAGSTAITAICIAVAMSSAARAEAGPAAMATPDTVPVPTPRVVYPSPYVDLSANRVTPKYQPGRIAPESAAGRRIRTATTPIATNPAPELRLPDVVPVPVPADRDAVGEIAMSDTGRPDHRPNVDAPAAGSDMKEEAAPPEASNGTVLDSAGEPGKDDQHVTAGTPAVAAKESAETDSDIAPQPEEAEASVAADISDDHRAGDEAVAPPEPRAADGAGAEELAAEETARPEIAAEHVRAPEPDSGAIAVEDGVEADALQPYQLVRSLQYVQDSVVQGDHSAMEMQRYLLGLIDERLRKADQEVFDNPRNVDAALIYAMSGGNPATLDLLALEDRFGHFDNEITTFLRAYLDGKAVGTQTPLDEILEIYRDSPLSPYIALVAANIRAGLNDDSALGLFDLARLGAPGTIIEEAALRRSLSIAAAAGDIDRSLHYAELYARRFARSPYAGMFADQLVDLAVEHYERMGSEGVTRIAGFMPADSRRHIYLRISRRAAIAGKPELTLLAADAASALAEAGDPAPATLAGLYSGLVSVPTADIRQVTEALEQLGDAPLSPRDEALRKAARRIAEAILRKPDPNSLTQAITPIMAEAGMTTEPDVATGPLARQQDPLDASSAASPGQAQAGGEAGAVTTLEDEGASELPTSGDPDFRAYVEAKSNLLEQIDSLLAGNNGVETQ